MTLAKVILISTGSIIALYLLWQLVALPLIGYVIDRLTMKRNVRKMTQDRKKFEHEPSEN